MGIEVNCADPFIIMNNIHQNYENGIVTIAKKGIRCDGMIQFNKIQKNKDNGILVAGQKNFTKIHKNVTISDNRRAGVKVIEEAHASIICNYIHYNFGQGILLVEGTSAHIEQNNIYTNFKANIAFGGENSNDTVILKNQIYAGRSEGIFIIDSGFSNIYENHIFDNNDGIILFDASPHIFGNKIKDHQRTGIIASGSSFPKIERNEIYGNACTGILVRDNSEAFINKNKIHENYYQLSIRSLATKKIKYLKESNIIDGSCELPFAFCSIM